MNRETPDSRPTTAAHLDIELLYLDLSQCGRCKGALTALETAIEATRPALQAMGMTPALVGKHVTSLDQARAEAFVASPTIRVAGLDIQPEAFQSPCQECGDLCGCGDGVDCRVWSWNGERHTEPPVAMLVGAILDRARTISHPEAMAVSPSQATGDSDGNLKRFFDGKAEQDACCSAGCCV